MLVPIGVEDCAKDSKPRVIAKGQSAMDAAADSRLPLVLACGRHPAPCAGLDFRHRSIVN